MKNAILEEVLEEDLTNSSRGETKYCNYCEMPIKQGQEFVSRGNNSYCNKKHFTLYTES